MIHTVIEGVLFYPYRCNPDWVQMYIWVTSCILFFTNVMALFGFVNNYTQIINFNVRSWRIATEDRVEGISIQRPKCLMSCNYELLWNQEKKNGIGLMMF